MLTTKRGKQGRCSGYAGAGLPYLCTQKFPLRIEIIK